MSRKPSHFLWPEPTLMPAVRGAFSLRAISDVEFHLRELFPQHHAVLCSSARAALSLWLEGHSINRANAVELFDYASHCVIDAVGRLGTPVCTSTMSDGVRADLRIIYHQWGFEAKTQHLSGLDLEDAVDSLCIPGAKLAPNGGGAEVWSLTKIFGTSGGGVLMCRDESTAEKLRILRDARGSKPSLWLCRLLGKRLPTAYLMWQGAEAAFGKPPRLLVGEIHNALFSHNDLIADRREKYDMLRDLQPRWLAESVERLPCAVPIETNEHSLALLQRFGFTAGTRTFPIDMEGRMEMKKVIPVPIHQDVSLSTIERFRAALLARNE